MHSVLTSLRTITLYGVARIQYIAATPAVWRGIGLLAFAVLAVTGTYAAWRTRTAPAETAVVADLGLEAGLAPEAAASQEPDNAAATALTPAAVTSAEPSGVRDDTMNPFTGQSLAEERTSRVWEQRLAAVQHELEVARTQVQIAEQHKELARLRRETQAMTHPPRTPAPPPVPRVAVLGVASTAALVNLHDWRGVVQPGTTIGGWTVVRLEPAGVTLAHERRHVFLPLSFASPAASRQR